MTLHRRRFSAAALTTLAVAVLGGCGQATSVTPGAPAHVAQNSPESVTVTDATGDVRRFADGSTTGKATTDITQVTYQVKPSTFPHTRHMVDIAITTKAGLRPHHNLSWFLFAIGKQRFELVEEVPSPPYLLVLEKNNHWALVNKNMPSRTTMPNPADTDRTVHLTFPTTLLKPWPGPLTHLTTVVRSGGPRGNGPMGDDVHAEKATLAIPAS